MPLFMIERTFADQLDLSESDVRLIEEVNTDEGVRWLFSFLSADRRRTYCLYEAPSAGAILAAAQRNGIPADEIVEVQSDTIGVPGRLHEWTVSSPSQVPAPLEAALVQREYARPTPGALL